MAGMGGDALQNQMVQVLQGPSKNSRLFGGNTEPVETAVDNNGIINLQAGLPGGPVHHSRTVDAVDANHKVAALSKFQNPFDVSPAGHRIGIHDVPDTGPAKSLTFIQSTAQETCRSGFQLLLRDYRTFMCLHHGPQLLAVPVTLLLVFPDVGG